MRLGEVSIPTFGPQQLPLGDSNRFGIALDSPLDAEIVSNQEKSSLNGWTRCYGERDAWLHFATTITPNAISLSVKSIGNEQLQMVFYVQAKKCVLGDGSQFFPGELRSYEGVQNTITFDQCAHFRCKEKSKIHLIPLSGDDCFWNANFLLSFDFIKTRSLFDVINLVLD